MRVLLDYRPALRERTGVGEYVHQIARALATQPDPDDALVLFSSSWKDRLAPDAVPGASTVDRRVPVRALNWLWHRRGWPAVERLAGSGFDVVHAAHPLRIPARAAATVITIHDLDFLDHPERTRAEIRRDYPALARAHATAADGIVVVSPHTAREVERRLGVPAERLSICPPGTPDWPRRDDEPAAGGIILFLGTVEPRKNLGVLLDAYERLLARRPDAPPLVLAGRVGPEADALVARARRPPFAGRVQFPGYVRADDKRALYARALVFVLPSHLEGFGISAVEAMTVGVPVIAADRGALPDTVGDAGRLVAPDDAEAIAAALDDLVADRDARQRMRERGWAHVRQFTWAETAARVRDAWARAIAHRRQTRG